MPIQKSHPTHRMVVYRDRAAYFSNAVEFSYYTTPFLKGVGCGGGGDVHGLLQSAVNAVRHGYVIVAISPRSLSRTEYPLHPEIAAALACETEIRRALADDPQISDMQHSVVVDQVEGTTCGSTLSGTR